MILFSGDVWDLLGYPATSDRFSGGRKHLWAVSGGDRREIQYKGTPLAASEFDSRQRGLREMQAENEKRAGNTPTPD